MTMDPQIQGLQKQIDDLQNQLEALQTQSNNFDSARVNLFDIFGTFQTVTVAPTLVPSTPYDQLVVAHISSTWYLYVYDMVGAVWKKVTLT